MDSYDKKERLRRRVFDLIQIGHREDPVSRLFDFVIVTTILINILCLFLETFDELAAPEGAELVEYEMNEMSPAAIIYTSGTTGRPKGAMLSQGNIVHNTQDFMSLTPMKEDDVALCVLPMYHCFGWICSVCCNLYIGATLVVQETYQFGDAMSLIKKYRVNTMCGVPTMYQLFVKGAEPENLANFTLFVSGGAALPLVLYDAFAKKFGRHVMEGYGLSEASPVVTFNRINKNKQGSIGASIPNVEVKIVDENFNEVPVGAVGELCVKGPNVMLGYWNRPKETAWTMRNGWLHTEDLCYKDEDGWIFIVDRLKDMIISSGENVYPREVEEVLAAHPDIREAAVVGIPDKLRGQAICAYIVPEDGGIKDKRMIRKYLLSRIAASDKFHQDEEQLAKNLDPAKYIGLSAHQVERFLAEEVRPVLAANESLIGMEAEARNQSISVSPPSVHR